ncbi:MAG: penicillin-binding protein [Clostridium sp.]|nr:penicillin-binding protein [Clostridium sp.]
MWSTLYDIQVVNGEHYYQLSQQRIAETETVEADRGNILDSYGRVLVSNRTVYQVTLDTSLMGEAQPRNEILLSLLTTAREREVEWPDTLPITQNLPFRFTTDTPYFTEDVDENGNTNRNLTKLGKLCVLMKWIEDPTEEPAPAPASEVAEPGLLDRLLMAVGLKSEPEADVQSDTPAPLPTAEALLGLMCESFSIQGEGAIDPETLEEGDRLPAMNIGDMSRTDARALAGLLYELYLRSKGVSTTEYIFAQEVDTDFITRVKELKLSGVEIEPAPLRQYHTSAAAHILGQAGPIFREDWEYYKSLDNNGDGVGDYQMNDTVGRDGVELAFESHLRGTAGIRTLERNVSGKIVSSQWLEEPEPGGNVVLTIDSALQEKVEETLASYLPNLESKEVEGAACVILDVNSAAVLSSASYPTFSLETFNADWNELSTDPLTPTLNRALQGLYPPGSTFKMVTAVAGLEEGIVSPSTIIYDEGRYTYYTANGPQCWIYRQYGRTHEKQNVSEAIMNSCNYYFFEVGRQLGIKTLADYAGRFGLGQKTGLELYEEAGIMAGPEYTQAMGGIWYDGNTLSVAIGQESSQFTPIQLANYIATLVNGGTRYATHLLKEVKSSDYSQVIYRYEPEVLSTIDIDPRNLEAVKKGMLALTTEGSVAGYFKDLDVRVGAKTGSAQVSTQTESNAVFVCFAPYDDPEIAMAIVVEHGGSGSELGAIAAEILKYYFSSHETGEEILTENTLIM